MSEGEYKRAAVPSGQIFHGLPAPGLSISHLALD